jgi:hypothetical protein
MNTEKIDDLFVKSKDMAGNEFVCPPTKFRNVKNVSDEDLEHCFEGDLVGTRRGAAKYGVPRRGFFPAGQLGVREKINSQIDSVQAPAQ